MAIDYTISAIDSIGQDQYSSKDTELTSIFDINSSVDLRKDKIETHFFDLNDNLIDSIYDSVNIQTNQDSETITDGKPSSIKLNPKDDVVNNGFGDSSVKVVYNFLSNLFSETKQGGKFFIETISEDRTEIRLLSTEVSSQEIVNYSDIIIKDLESTSYFEDFRLNTRDNNLYIAVNIKTEDYRGYKAVLIKLYEPLPETVEEKAILTIDKKVADSVAYEVTAKFTPEVPKLPYIKGPNFIVTEEESASPTSYLNYKELFDFPTNNSYRELNSLFSEKGITLSIDYSDFANFAHFSSVEERLKNFQYKLNLIEEYQVSASSAAVARESGSVTFTSGSDIFWKDKLDGIINNFDHYDRHLYYSSGSTSWPKQSPQEKPYIQATGSATGSFVSEFFGNELSSGSSYDDNNPNLLINTVPEYIRDDNDSVKYSTFIHMLAQHFDNLYVYSKALSDKYDNDNRLDFGASRDLIQDLLKNFGVKIYNNVRSAESLFDIYSGQSYQTGSDTVTNLISASDTPVSTENYRTDIHKRIYHNLPYLLKTKGTERGLKALIASFGIPTDNNIIGSGSNISGLYVRTFGGGTTGSFNAGPLTAYTSSIGKIRTDDTGSIVSGSTLSQYASIITRDKKYSDDIHSIEVGYSPTYELDKKIINDSTTGFNIDNFIGDPGQAYSSSYEQLVSQSIDTLAPSFDINLSRNKSEFGYQQILNTPNINVATGSIPSIVPTTPGYVYSPTWAQEYVVTDGVVNIGSGSTIILDPNGVSIDVGDELVGDHSATDITIWYATVTEVVNSTTIKANIHVQIPDGTTLTRLEGSVPLKGRYLLGQNNNLVKVTATTGANVLSVYTEEPINTLYGEGGQYAASPTVKFTYNYFSYPYNSHNYGELVRYLKYYDNVLFKMIKDFVPARANVDTGLIIKPHILERNKIKQVEGSFSTSSYLSEINTAFSSASDGSAFTNKIHQELAIPLTASYSESIVTSHVSGGLVTYHYHEKERTRYDGEFSGSKEIVYEHTLNDGNEWKYTSPTDIFYKTIGVSKLACPTLSLLSVTGSYSPDQFIFSGSFEAPEAGIYYISYQPSDNSSYAQSLAPITVTVAGTTHLWNTTSTLGFSALTPGTLYPTASIQLSGSDCGTIKAPETMSFTIGAQPEVCPTLSTLLFEAQEGQSGSDYNSSFPGGYSNPSGLQLIMSGGVTQLPDGDPIYHIGFVIGTSNPPTVSGSGVEFQGIISHQGGGPATTVGSFGNTSTRTNSIGLDGNTEWIEPNTTYYMRTYASASSTCGDYVYGPVLSDTTGASTYIASQSYEYGSVSTSTVCTNFHNESGNNSGYFWTYSGGTFGVPFAIATHLYTAPIAEAAYAAPSNFYVSGSAGVDGSATIRTVGSNGAFTTSANCPYTP